jgi:pilus assembly protein CpaF
MSLMEKIQQAKQQGDQRFQEEEWLSEPAVLHETKEIEEVNQSVPLNTLTPVLEEDESQYLQEYLNQTDLSDDEFLTCQELILEFMREENKNIDLMSKEELILYLVSLIDQKDHAKKIKAQNVYPLVNSLVDDIKNYGPIQEFMTNPEVSDVRIIGDLCVKYKIRGKYHTSKDPRHRFRSEEHLHSWINRKIGLSRMGGRFDKGLARANALLLDGSRLHAITTVSGVGEWRDGKCIPTPHTIVSIRKFAKCFTIQELAETTYVLDQKRIAERTEWIKAYEHLSTDVHQQKTRFMNELIAAYLHLICRLRYTIIYAGGTGAGKTTFLNASFEFIPEYHVNGIVEEKPELQPDHPETIRLWERPANLEGTGEITIADLLKEILRMDVDRFFIAELRDSIAYLFLQGIINGHPGGMTTIHGTSAMAALLRLITLASSYPGSSRQDILHMIEEGVQTFIHIETTDENHKYINEIMEVDRLEGDEIKLCPVFTVEFQESGDWEWKFHGLSERVIKEARKRKMAIPSILLTVPVEQVG